MPDNWKTLSARMKESDIPTFNIEMKKLGYSSLNDLAQTVLTGGFTNEKLVDALVDRIVNKEVHGGSESSRDQE